MEKRAALAAFVGGPTIRLCLAVCLCLLTARALQARTLTTVAGSGTQGFSGEASAPTSAQLNLPAAVWGRPSGDVWVADAGNHRIRRITAAGDTIVTVAGTGTAGFSGNGGAATSAQLHTPSGVWADSTGQVWVSDTDNHRIRRISAAGVISNLAGSGRAGFRDTTLADSARFRFPTGICVDRSGNAYVADTGNHRVRRISATTGAVTTVAGTGEAGFSGDGERATRARLSGPMAVYVDTAGNLYIADTNNHRIRRVAALDSTISTVAGTQGAGYSGDGGLATRARLAFPAGVVVGPDTAIYIADGFNHRIRRVNPAGDITTLSGDGTYGYSGDGGAANRATLASPTGLYLDRSGALYIADTANQRVRRIGATDALGPSGPQRVGPGRSVRLLAVPFTGDGSTAVCSLACTVADRRDTLATGLVAADLVSLDLYESTDDSLGSSDALLGRLDSTRVTLGRALAVRAEQPVTPGAGATRWYLLAARISRTATQGHALTVRFPTGGLGTTTGGRGARVAASDTSYVRIDATATRLAFTRQPAHSLTGYPLLVQPVVSALDDSGFVDYDFERTVQLGSTGPGTLLHASATAEAGVATFSYVTYNAVVDGEAFNLVATDAGSLLPEATSVELRASVVNDPPRVSLDDLIMSEDDPIGYRVALRDVVHDPDDTDLTVTPSSRHLEARVVGDSLIIQPQPDWFGTDTLTVTVTDPFGLQAVDRILVQARAVNDPPRLSFPAVLSAAEDETLRVDLRSRVTDVDDDFGQLTWSFAGSTGLISAWNRDAGWVDLWAGPDVAGLFTLTVQARDPLQATGRDTVAVQLVAVNDAPRLSVPDLSMRQGDSLRVNLRSYTTDVDDPVDRASWSVVSRRGATVTSPAAGTVVLRYPATFYGTDTLEVRATDPAGATGTDQATLTVTRVNRPPALSTPPDTVLAPLATLVWDLAPYASDPDDAGELLAWQATPAGRLTASMAGSLLRLTAPATDTAYTENVRIRVADPAGFSATAFLRVRIVPEPALIAGLPDIEFEAGRFAELALAPYLRDRGVSVGVRADTVLQILLDPTTLVASIETRSQWKGVAQVVFEASTREGETGSDTIAVRVTNPPPVLLAFAPLTLVAGQQAEVSLDPQVWDDEPAERLSWSAQADRGLRVTFDPARRLATVAADRAALGELRARLTVRDAQGAADTDTLRVTVVPVGAQPGRLPPTVAPIPDLVLPYGTRPRLELDLYAEDDGPLSALRWQALVVPDTVLQVIIGTERTATFVALRPQGRATVTLTATDPSGLSASRQMQVTVQPNPQGPVPGDFDGNARVTLEDFFLFADALGLTSLHPDWDPAFDLDDDGRVSFDDFSLFADLFVRANAAR
ncbi:MAG: tandem-95 repeat protein [Candidatus Latescibacterota bacterium]